MKYVQPLHLAVCFVIKQFSSCRVSASCVFYGCFLNAGTCCTSEVVKLKLQHPDIQQPWYDIEYDINLQCNGKLMTRNKNVDLLGVSLAVQRHFNTFDIST